MTLNEIIELNKKNISKALDDYGMHTDATEVLDDISEDFINIVAEKSAKAKSALRELFRKSPVWNEELQALIINGTRTHDPDYGYVAELGYEILKPAIAEGKITNSEKCDIVWYFSNPEDPEQVKNSYLDVINRIAPKAYAPNKKPSRIFKAICKELGVVDETAGSDFQKYFALFADELSSKKIEFKLFVSINPAHFLTMSNPKYDSRGTMLTSCHSLNNTEYTYNCGCSGYACDDVSFIAFTVADPADPETLNNRKTTRQVFAYKPNNGVLLQSRLYNTSGGTRGAQSASDVYRDLIQRELSALEEVPNLWKTGGSCEKYSELVKVGDGFGGYPDWHYSEFDAKISVRNDHEQNCEPIIVGTYGHCISCGKAIYEGLYCGECKDYERCEDCDEYCSETYTVYDAHGDVRYVCDYCRSEYYTYCDRCERYHPNGLVVQAADDDYVCDDCLERYYTYCDICEEYHHKADVRRVKNEYGNWINVCKDCLDEKYIVCQHCGEYVHADCTYTVIEPDTNKKLVVCHECKKKHYTNVEEREVVCA